MKKEFKMLGGSVIIWLILAVGYFIFGCTNYPQVKLERDEFYGKDIQNLKDFIMDDGMLVSSSQDPWVNCILEERINIKVIELNVDNLSKEGQIGEIFDMDTWESERFQIHNGKVFVFYTNMPDLGKKNLRFDLVENQGVSLDVSSVIINSRLGLLYITLECFMPLLWCIILVLRKLNKYPIEY